MNRDLALKLAVRALWHLARDSRCWSSRQVALIALKAIALVEEEYTESKLEVVEGLPDDPELALVERPDVLYEQVEDFLTVWSGAKPR